MQRLVDENSTLSAPPFGDIKIFLCHRMSFPEIMAFDFFRRASSPHFSWPTPEKYKPLNSYAEVRVQAIAAQTRSLDQQVFPLPTLLIGLGDTGSATMHLLLEKMHQVENFSAEKTLRALLITEPAKVPFRMPEWCHIVDLRQGTLSGVRPMASTLSARARPADLFRQIVNYGRYRDWLQNDLRELRGQVQVFFFGSLGESSIGILEDALHLLNQVSKEEKRPCKKCVFLALHGNQPISEEEQFATIREIARLTFNGPHKIPGKMGLIEEPLIDFWFTFDTTVTHPHLEPSVLLAEILFSLLHPSALTLWEHLQNDLQSAGQVREKSGNAVIHSAGIATFYLPVEAVRKYFSARLARDMLFGEGRVGETLQSRTALLTAEQEEAFLHQWFDVEPSHPFFQWLLTRSSPTDFEPLPSLDAAYDGLFVSRLIHGLYRSLNQDGVSLDSILQVLERLSGRLSRYQEWLKRARNVSDEAISSMQEHFVLWKRVVMALISDIKAWQETFSARSLPSLNSFPVITRWGEPPQDDKLASFSPIAELLEQEYASAEKELQKLETEPVCRSPIQRKEIEKYYTDTVYPDLSARSQGALSLSQRLSQRLEWWLEVDRDWTPHLLFVCWPAEANGRSVPEAAYSFRPNQKKEIIQALLNLAASQTAFLQEDLIHLFGHQVKTHPDFLRRASQPYLLFDQDLAYRYANAVLRHAYIIAPGPGLGNELVRDVFPDLPPNVTNVFENGAPSRFTALTLWMNIPLEAVSKLRELQERYWMGMFPEWHFHNQERSAVKYEKCWWQLQRERLSISPELTSLLAEPDLVSLFFQALFAGLISVVRRENGEKWWWLSGLPPSEEDQQEFPPMFLSPANRDGLFNAFRKFVIELPNSPETVLLNPHSPFHPEQRGHFVHLLRSEVRQRRAREAHRSLNPEVKEELQKWEQYAKYDPVAAAFLAMMRCELNEPVLIQL